MRVDLGGNLKKLSLAASLAASIFVCASAAYAADYRELNHQAIAYMRAGDYVRAEELFKQALAAYSPEESHFDLTIKNNLAVLQQNESYRASYEKNKPGEQRPALLGQVSTSDGLLSFAQGYFDKAATERFQRITSVPMKAAKIQRLKANEFQIRYSAEIVGERVFEITALINQEANGSYKMLNVHADVYRKTSLKSNAIAWNASTSLFKADDDLKSTDARDEKFPLRSAASRSVLQAIEAEDEARLEAEKTRMLEEQAAKEEAERLAKVQEENERIAAEETRLAEEKRQAEVQAATAAATAAFMAKSAPPPPVFVGKPG